MGISQAWKHGSLTLVLCEQRRQSVCMGIRAMTWKDESLNRKRTPRITMAAQRPGAPVSALLSFNPHTYYRLIT